MATFAGASLRGAFAMSDEMLARIEERTKAIKERLEKLELNQRWAVLAIIGLVISAVFQLISRGVGM